MSWQAASLIVLSLALVAGFGWYERDKPPARVLALVATLAALAVVGRLAFAAIPNVKPTTDIVLFAGYALGAVPGFAVGAVTAVVSNVFLSQGPWTPWQMAGWGAVGISGALLAWAMRGREVSRVALAAICGVAGLAFGAWMDLYQLTLAAHQDLETYLAISASSLPYNLAHAAGNVVFCLLIGPVFIRALRRYRRRLEVSWRVPAAASAAVLFVVLLLPAAAGAASPADRAERWLLRAQNSDGGFGGAPKASSSALISGWSALGLAAAQRNPRDVRRPGGRTLAAYISSSSKSVADVGGIERTMLVLEAAGLSSREFRGGRDLVAALTRRRRANGSIGGFVSYTAFGILALRAAGAPAGSSTISWLVSAQNDDGGFGLAPGSASESDMTGAVLQALAEVGRSRGAAAKRAVAWLRANQNDSGGFGQFRGRSSNAQSTSYAVQGLVAAGAGGAALTRAIDYLEGLQRSNGSIAYSGSSTQTPVWVTAQALMALEREPLPLATVPRAEPPEPEPQASATEGQPPAPAPSAPPPSGSGGAVDGGAADEGTVSGRAADDGAPPARGGDRSETFVPGIRADEPPADDPYAPPDGGLRVDQGGGGAGNASGEGGPAAWMVALLLGASGLAVLLIRRRLPAITNWLHTLNPWFEKP
jgi:energy-coupling factor transport system substrate-specific component